MGKQECRPTALQAFEQEHSILHSGTRTTVASTHVTPHATANMPCLQAHKALPDPTSCPASVHPVGSNRAAKKPEQETNQAPRGQDRQTQPQQKARRLGTLAVPPTLFQLVGRAELKCSEAMRASAPVLMGRFSCC